MAALRRSGLRGDSLARVKSMFFDRGAVTRGMDAATRRALSRFGAYVRGDSRKSIRKARNSKPSRPGRPPKSRKGTLKRHIYFVYEPQTRNVVIGPELLPRSRTDNLVMLEHGGRRQMRVPGRDPRNPRRITKLRVIASYPPRPFMQPAFDKNLPKAADLYKDQLAKAA